MHSQQVRMSTFVHGILFNMGVNCGQLLWVYVCMRTVLIMPRCLSCDIRAILWWAAFFSDTWSVHYIQLEHTNVEA